MTVIILREILGTNGSPFARQTSGRISLKFFWGTITTISGLLDILDLNYPEPL